MKNVTDILYTTDVGDYGRQFWNAMRFRQNSVSKYDSCFNTSLGSYYLPAVNEKALRNAIRSESAIRSLATEISHYSGGGKMWAADSKDRFAFVQEGAPIPGFDADGDFTKFLLESRKVAGLVKVNNEFVNDAAFDLEKYLTERMSRSFALAEDSAFISGDGSTQPHGLLHPTAGAETGVTTESLSYDDVIDLFFSVKPEYRKKATWVMNDRTALVLRKLKDDDSMYLWDGSHDDLLGRPVVICNDMPDIEAGSNTVLFGDFAYYWIIDRSPISSRALKELFAETDRVGYLAFKFLDARLVRRDALKCITVTGGSH